MSTVLPTALRRKVAAATALATGGLALAAVPTAPAYAADSPTTVQVSVKTGGFEPGWGDNSGTPVFSADGRYAVFAASGPVVPGQPRIQFQVVRRDRQLGTTELISKNSDGVMANTHSSSPAVSADGNVIAFNSAATNLVPGDTNKDTDAFVHDIRTGTTTRVSVTSSGGQVDAVGQANSVGPPSISADGRYVGFTSTTKGYTADDTDKANAYLYDRATNTIEVVSRNSDGHVISNHVSTKVTVSGNGDFVAFQTLVDNTAIQVLVRERGTGTTTEIGGREWRDLRQDMTPNGRYVVYDTGDDEQVLGEADTNNAGDVFVHDRVARTYERVSVSSNGTQANGTSSHASISDDGRYVTFRSTATNLVAGDTNGKADVFLHDRQTGTTTRASLTDDGQQAKDGGVGGSISGDGQHIGFSSYTRLTPALTAGGYSQSYVRDLTGKYPALVAGLGRTPNRAIRKETYRIPTVDIRTGPALQITWTPASGKVVKQTAAVQNNAFTLRTPNRHGKYTLTVSYADNLLDTRTITVPRPSAKKLAKSVKKGKKLRVRTVGVKTGQKVKVVFTPHGKTKGKKVVRTARTNKSGAIRVTSPKKRGTYRVVVKVGSSTLRKARIRVR